MQSLKRNGRQYAGSEDIAPLQVACVLKALADHTLIMHMSQHRPDPDSPWPKETSVGRWFHDMADFINDKEA